MRANIDRAFNTEDFRRIAKRRLPKGLFEFVDRGAEDELTLRANRAAFERIPLFHRALVDVSARNMDVSLFGRKFKAPIAVAPTGAAGLLWFEGEIAMARAAAKLGIPFTISTASITPLEAVAKASDGELWFQLYVWPDLDMTFQLVDRARNAGYRALVVTVDSAVPSNREYNKRNGFTIPIRYTARNVTDALLHPSWLVGVYGRQLLANGVPTFANFPTQLQTDLRGSVRKGGSMVPKNETVTWDLLRRLRDRWDGPLMVKGILHPDDALMAEQCGARCGDRVQPWRPQPGRRGGDAGCVAGHRRCGRRADDADAGQRRAARRGCGEGAGARRAGRPGGGASRYGARRPAAKRGRIAR